MSTASTEAAVTAAGHARGRVFMSNGEMTTRLVHSGFTRRTALVLGTPDARRFEPLGFALRPGCCQEAHEAGRRAGWLAGRQAGWLAASIITHLCVISIFVFQQAIISLRVGRADSLVEQ